MQSLSCVWLSVTPWTPPGSSVRGIPYWSGSPFPSPGNPPTREANSCFLCLLHRQVCSLPLSHLRSPAETVVGADMVQWPYHCPMADNSNSASYIADAHLRLMRKEDRYGTEKEKYRLWVWAECGTRGSPSLKQWMTNKVQQKESMSNHRYKEHLQRRRWENKRKFEDCRFMPGTLENQTKWELNNSLVVCLIEVVEDVEINYSQRNYLNVSVGTRSH